MVRRDGPCTGSSSPGGATSRPRSRTRSSRATRSLPSRSSRGSRWRVGGWPSEVTTRHARWPWGLGTGPACPSPDCFDGHVPRARKLGAVAPSVARPCQGASKRRARCRNASSSSMTSSRPGRRPRRVPMRSPRRAPAGSTWSPRRARSTIPCPRCAFRAVVPILGRAHVRVCGCPGNLPGSRCQPRAKRPT